MIAKALFLALAAFLGVRIGKWFERTFWPSGETRELDRRLKTYRATNRAAPNGADTTTR